MTTNVVIDIEIATDYHTSKLHAAQRCGFCYDSEQGTHGEVRRVWSNEWMQFIPLCARHSGAEELEHQAAITFLKARE